MTDKIRIVEKSLERFSLFIQSKRKCYSQEAIGNTPCPGCTAGPGFPYSPRLQPHHTIHSVMSHAWVCATIKSAGAEGTVGIREGTGYSHFLECLDHFIRIQPRGSKSNKVTT